MIERRSGFRRQTDQDCLLTDQKVAELAMVSVSSVRYWRQMGILPFVKVGRHPRIWLSEFHRVFSKPLANKSFEPVMDADKRRGVATFERKRV